jgi:hypothetical protein
MIIKFGIKAKERELDSIAEILAGVLKVKFEPHESSFRGGEYWSAEVPKGEVFLQSNRDELPEDDPFESGWPIDELILYLAGEEDEFWQKELHALETTKRIGVVRLK